MIKQRKRWLLFLVVGVLAFAMVGCGGDTSDEGDDEAVEETTGSVYQGEGFTIEYPDTVTQKTNSVGEEELVDNNDAFSVVPQLWDGDFETVSAKWINDLRGLPGFSHQDVEVDGKTGVRIYSVSESMGAEILYLIPYSDEKTLALSFTHPMGSGVLEDMIAEAGIEEIVNGIKIE